MKRLLPILLTCILLVSSLWIFSACGEDAIPDVQITFQLDDGTTYKVLSLKENAVPTMPEAPTKEGYTFVSWQLDGVDFDFTQPVLQDVVLKASFKAGTYNVKFVDGDTEVSKSTVTYPTVIFAEEAPEKEGYTFISWQVDGVDYDFTKPVTQDLVLVASYEINTYTVQFKDGDTEISHVDVEYSSTVEAASAPAKDGYTFTEWQLDGKAYDFSTPVTSDLVLIALYDKVLSEGDTCKVTYYTSEKDICTKDVLWGEDAPLYVCENEQPLYDVVNAEDVKNIRTNKRIEVKASKFAYMTIGVNSSGNFASTYSGVASNLALQSYGAILYQSSSSLTFKASFRGDLWCYRQIIVEGRSIKLTVTIDGSVVGTHTIGKESGRLKLASNVPAGEHTVLLTVSDLVAGSQGFSQWSGLVISAIYMWEANIPALDAPVVSIDEDGIATWSAISNAKGYIPYVNGQACAEQKELTYTLTAGDEFCVVAVGDGSDYSNSQKSVSATYVGPKAIATPAVSISDKGVATWKAVEHASGYVCYVNGTAQPVQTECTITLQEGDTLKVVAKGSGKLYLDSAESKLLTYTAPLEEGEEEYLEHRY